MFSINENDEKKGGEKQLTIHDYKAEIILIYEWKTYQYIAPSVKSIKLAGK